MAQFSTATFQLHKATAFHCLISIRLSTYIQIIILNQIYDSEQLSIISKHNNILIPLTILILIEIKEPMRIIKLQQISYANTIQLLIVYQPDQIMINCIYIAISIFKECFRIIFINTIQFVLPNMKRRVNKNGGSFDLIKFTPKKSNETTNGNTRDGVFAESPTKPIVLENQQKKLRKYLHLPKIPTQHMKYNYIKSKNRSEEMQEDMNYNRLENKLLLMGYQYHKEIITLRSSKKHDYTDINQSQQKNKVVSQCFEHNDLIQKKSTQLREISSPIFMNKNIRRLIVENKRIAVYIQQGNNSRMVKEIFRKRLQFIFTNQKKDANIVWTRFCDYESSRIPTRFRIQKMQKKRQPSEFETENESQEIESPGKKLSRSLGVNNVYEEKIYKPKCQAYMSNREDTQKQSEIDTEQQVLIFGDLHYHNHLRNHHEISDKKSLFKNLQIFCKKQRLDIFSIVPVTYEFSYNSMKNQPVGQSNSFLPAAIEDTGLWFIKPGQDTNRGEGISIAEGRQKISKAVHDLFTVGKTAIVQQYINPLLYKNRKFDIRCYALVVSFRGELKAYWYNEGYIRTCSKQFNQDPKDVIAHLTNDAVQKKSPLYGKYEQSNKLSFNDLDIYMKSKDLNFRQTKQHMKMLAYYSIKAAQDKLLSESKEFSFEIFGYDFLINNKGKVWLIEVNTNPCLQFTGSLTSRIIWHMVDNSFKICLDPLLSSNNQYAKQESLRQGENNKYECII